MTLSIPITIEKSMDSKMVETASITLVGTISIIAPVLVSKSLALGNRSHQLKLTFPTTDISSAFRSARQGPSPCGSSNLRWICLHCRPSQRLILMKKY
jgi:hypothetical protein